MKNADSADCLKKHMETHKTKQINCQIIWLEKINWRTRKTQLMYWQDLSKKYIQTRFSSNFSTSRVPLVRMGYSIWTLWIRGAKKNYNVWSPKEEITSDWRFWRTSSLLAFMSDRQVQWSWREVIWIHRNSWRLHV